MAFTQINPEPNTQPNPDAIAPASLFVHLASQSPDSLNATLSNLALAFPNQAVLVATPDSRANSSSIRLVPYTPSIVSTTHWVLTAANYLNACKLHHEHPSATLLLLGANSQTLSPEALRALASSSSDLTLARYVLAPREGLVNSAILYPVTRALFTVRPRFPLAVDLALSPRMAHRLAAAAERLAASGQNDAPLWPASEAAVAGYTISEIDAASRPLPHPTANLYETFAQITGSLFSDVTAKAAFWQRARPAPVLRQNAQPVVPIGPTPAIASMIESFHLAYTDLHEIWTLVLPPNSLLGLKRLSAMPASSFRMPDTLWARIVYDFLVAYRLRTIYRGHLLGALTPLYLAWAASHLLLVNSGAAPEKHIEDLAAAFENDKPYLVSRWRWPNSFTP